MKKLSYILIIVLSFSSCDFFYKEKDKKTLNVIMRNSVLGYVEKDTITEGFQYEIVRAFADSFGYQLNIITYENLENSIKQINSNKADILAYALPTTLSMKQKLEFSVPLYTTKLVLVQKKRDKKEKKFLAKNISDLEEKTIYVSENSLYIKQLEYIIEDSGIQFRIAKRKQSIEKLAEQVANGKIEYFATNSLIAQYLSSINNEIDYSMPLGLSQFMAWGINKKNQKINEQLNLFLENFVKTEKYREIYRKYFS